MVDQDMFQAIKNRIAWLAISQGSEVSDILELLTRTDWTSLVEDTRSLYHLQQEQAEAHRIRFTHLCDWCQTPYRMDEPPYSQSVCPACHPIKYREETRVRSACQRTKQLGLPSTLTLRQWLATLDYFDWKCAYCHDQFEVLDHFIPVVLRGGTIQGNCIPACNACNSKKFNTHPGLLTFPSRDALESIHAYFIQFS